MLEPLILCLLAYCLGSLSSAVIVCRLANLPDPRTTGSHNPGATNVLRLGNKKAAALTLMGDALKGLLPVWLATHLSLSPEWIGLVLLAVFLGHLYPLFFGFQGGKGVATAAGALCAISWPAGILLIATWLGMLKIFKISSLAALTAALCAPFYILWLKGERFLWPVALMSLLLFWKHRANIGRLIQKTEPKVGQHKAIKNQ